jgi:hypothetical protein
MKDVDIFKNPFADPLFDWFIDHWCSVNEFNRIDLIKNSQKLYDIQDQYNDWCTAMKNRNDTQTMIYVTLRVEGFHCFPSATQIFGSAVDFLQYNHRHIFHVTVYKNVEHDDRDKEFILLKREIEVFLRKVYGKSGVCEFGAMSCEMIARIILTVFDAEQVAVSEDGENGAIISKTSQPNQND